MATQNELQLTRELLREGYSFEQEEKDFLNGMLRQYREGTNIYHGEVSFSDRKKLLAIAFKYRRRDGRKRNAPDSDIVRRARKNLFEGGGWRSNVYRRKRKLDPPIPFSQRPCGDE